MQTRLGIPSAHDRRMTKLANRKKALWEIFQLDSSACLVISYGLNEAVPFRLVHGHLNVFPS